MKILGIVRASTDKQETESQKNELIDFCIEKGFHKNDIVIIEVVGASARKLNDKYIAMLDSIKSIIINDGIKYVALWHLNRLGRVESKLIEMKDFFKKNGVQVYVKYPSFQLFQDNGKIDEGGNIFWSILSVSIEKDSEEQFAKMSRGKRRNASQGRYNGGKVKYGYSIDENGFYVVNENGDNVKLIFELYASGKYSVSQLSNELSSRGINLDRNYIQTMLSSTCYIGYNEHNGVFRTYPRIISDELYEKAKQVRLNNKNAISKTDRYDFATKLIKCPYCGYYYTNQMYSKKRGNNGIYCCWNHAIEHKCNNSLSISLINLDRLLWYVAKDEHIKYLMRNDKNEIESYENEIKVIIQKIDVVKLKQMKINDKKKKVALNYENDIYSNDEYIERLNQIKNEENKYKNELIEYSHNIDKLNRLINSINDKKNDFNRFVNAVESIDINKKDMHDIVKLHIKSVELKSLDKTTMQIHIIKSNDDIVNITYYPRSKKKIRTNWYDKYYVNDKSISEKVYKNTYEIDYIYQ